MNQSDRDAGIFRHDGKTGPDDPDAIYFTANYHCVTGDDVVLKRSHPEPVFLKLREEVEFSRSCIQAAENGLKARYRLLSSAKLVRNEDHLTQSSL